MIVLFYGTSAELIKMFGIIQRVPRDELLLICSSQHHHGLKKVHKQLGFKPDIELSKGWIGKDVMTIPQMMLMMAGAHGRFLRKIIGIRKMIRDTDRKKFTKSIAVVHGDTLTTVVGCYMGRMLGLPVAHIEAGLRTHNWRSPFPEEIDRRVAAKFSTLHYPPSPTAEENLRSEKVRGDIVNTHFNTSKDAIEQSSKFLSKNFTELNLPETYCLVLLHRTELIENRDDFEAILKVIYDHASPSTPVVFTQHSTTWEKIRANKFEHYLKKDGLFVIPKQAYFDFMEIVRRSSYIVTDGGGLQEDAFFLGIPTVIHRKVTERQDGLGYNAELSELDVHKVVSFLNNHKDKSEFANNKRSISPSEIVIDDLKDRRYISK